MRPVAVDRRFAERASSVDHARRLPGDRRPRSRYLLGRGASVRGACRRRHDSISDLEQKGNKDLLAKPER